MKKYFFTGFFAMSMLLIFSSCEQNAEFAANGNNLAATSSGSYANMLTINDFLYAVTNTELVTFDVTDPTQLKELDRIDLGFGVESIFHHNGVLFIGSSQALHIYEIKDDGIPALKNRTGYGNFGVTQGFTVCDPVVANDTHAFVTLSTRTEGACGFQDINELRVYNVTNLENPILTEIVDMFNPKGLSLDGDLLFVCEDEFGFKIFDISISHNPQLLHHIEGDHTTDVILQDGLAIIVGPTALYEYDYSDIDNIQKLGVIQLD